MQGFATDMGEALYAKSTEPFHLLQSKSSIVREFDPETDLSVLAKMRARSIPYSTITGVVQGAFEAVRSMTFSNRYYIASPFPPHQLYLPFVPAKPAAYELSTA